MAANIPDQQDKRNFLRMQVDSPVSIVVVGEGEVISGICRDVSGDGMLVEVDAALPTDTELRVTLASSHGHAPVLRANARVTRVVELPDDASGVRRVGLQLTEILA